MADELAKKRKHLTPDQVEILARSVTTLRFERNSDALGWISTMSSNYHVVKSSTEHKDGWIVAVVEIPWAPNGRLLPADDVVVDR